MVIKSKVGVWSGLVAASLALAACGKGSPDASETLVSDVKHSTVKRQSIGNCWLYAHATWLESKMMSTTGQETDVSESYWTYWHWYNQIVGSSIDEISTGGSWGVSARIIRKYGWVREAEFIKEEDGTEMSQRQSSALNAINAELQEGGSLDTYQKRTPARVRAALDKAWGASMAQALKKAKAATATVVEKRPNGAVVTLEEALAGGADKRWNVVYFPRVYGQDTAISASVQAQRKQLLKRVMRAVNDRQPVVMSTMIDFNAMEIESEGSFKKSTLDKAGSPGRQGGHMLVLEDYVVNNAPGYGFLGEGDMDAARKAAALEGDVVYLKTKNSWGKNRPERGLTDGYTRFHADYLFSQLAWKDDPESDDSSVSYYTTLTDFVLPPGY